MSLTNSVFLTSVLSAARTYLNDDNATIWTDQLLVPKAQIAFKEVVDALLVAGTQMFSSKQLSPFVVPISAVPTVFLPNPLYLNFDILAPISVFESANPATYPYIPVTEVAYFPLDYIAGPTINYWTWQNEKVILAPCTASRTVILRYKTHGYVGAIGGGPSSSGQGLSIPFAELYMGARTAAIAAGSVGNAEVFAAMSAKAKENLARVVASNRGQQKPSNKP